MTETNKKNKKSYFCVVELIKMLYLCCIFKTNTMRKLNVLSLFDGMSCGQIALERVGIEAGNYYASEIDEHAIKVTQENYPETIQLGTVEDWENWNIDWSSIDLVCGGSPCQGFSFAGKQLVFDDPRSKLFFTFVDVCNRVADANPKMLFLLENVKMKKESLEVINKYMGVDPVFINSSLLSAQNRQRYYWTNISEVQQPEDMGVMLCDIIESGYVDRDKSYCLDANYFKGVNAKQYLCKSRRQVVWLIPDATKNGFVEVSEGQGIDLTFIKSKTRRGRLVLKKDSCLTATTHKFCIVTKEWFRLLTPIECERLQTVPENYTSSVSNTQRYKILGNGWTVDVIAHIFKEIKQ